VTRADLIVLEDVQRRITQAQAIASLLAEPLDTQLGEALRAIALMLNDAGNRLDLFEGAASREIRARGEGAQVG
jgi:hypothetical protein